MASFISITACRTCLLPLFCFSAHYDTLVSVLDVNNDQKNDLVYSYCNACNEELTLIFLNNGNSYDLSFQGGGCLSNIEIKNHTLTRLTTIPCQCCANLYKFFDDYILQDLLTFSYSKIEYSIQQLNLPEKFDTDSVEITTMEEKCLFPTSNYIKPKDIVIWELDSAGNKSNKKVLHSEDCLEKIPAGTKIKILGSRNKSSFILWEREKNKYVFGWIKNKK